MEAIHTAVAWLAAGAAVLGIVWSTAAIRAQPLRRPGLWRFQLVVVALLVTAAISGLGQLIAGAQPKEGLHFLYAGIAVAVLPLARSFVPAADRRANLAAAAAFVVLGFVVYRLFATG